MLWLKTSFFSAERIIYGCVGVIAVALFTWSALHNGWMNEYYSAAAASGATNLKAFFFASFDSASFISVDKLPLGVWPSAVSVALFGLSPLAIAAPHIIIGVLTTLVILRLVHEAASLRIGLVAVLLFLTTPIVSVIFGYNQPDSLFLFFALLSLYAVMRLLTQRQHSKTWAFIVGLSLGLAFMTKTLQILPLVFVYAGIGMWVIGRRRAFGVSSKLIIIGSLTFVVVALWWPLAVWLTPASQRPYIGSTQDNSPWSLIVGYNGLDRLVNAHQVVPQDTNTGTQFGGAPGALRLFNSEFSPLIAWYLPLLVPAIIGLVRRKERGPKEFLLAGLSTTIVVIYGLLFSFMEGIIHPYYSVFLAPFLAISAAFGMRWMIAWYRQKNSILQFVLPSILLVTTYLGSLFLDYDQTVVRQYELGLACTGLVAMAVLLLGRRLQWRAGLLWVISVVLIILCPAIETATSLARSHHGVFPAPYDTAQSEKKISPEAINYLATHDDGSRWLAVTESSLLASPIQLAVQRPVMALGGFNGDDPTISLAKLQLHARQHDIRYFVTSTRTAKSTMLPAIVSWLVAHQVVYRDTDTVIYDLRTNP